MQRRKRQEEQQAKSRRRNMDRLMVDRLAGGRIRSKTDPGARRRARRASAKNAEGTGGRQRGMRRPPSKSSEQLSPVVGRLGRTINVDVASAVSPSIVVRDGAGASPKNAYQNVMPGGVMPLSPARGVLQRQQQRVCVASQRRNAGGPVGGVRLQTDHVKCRQLVQWRRARC